MQCFVYKSTIKPDHYVYLPNKLLHLDASKGAPEGAGGGLPEALLRMLGDLEFVLEFELSAERQLPQAIAEQVMADVQAQGFYLQLPKKDMLAEEEAWIN